MPDDSVLPAQFRIPAWLVDSAWLEHGPFAFWLIRAHRPRTMVELGTYLGYSYAAFCEAIVDNRLTCRCAAVDTWRGDEHSGFYADQVFRKFAEFHERQCAAFSRLMRMTFDEAVASFADGSIDLLHIDGRHFYEDARHDFETWRGKVSERGVVLFHDTQVKERGFGVHRLWSELAARFPHFEFHHGHGLGVLGLGPHQTPAMKKLYAASSDPAEASDIRLVYSALGRSVSEERRKQRAREKAWEAALGRAQSA